MTYEELGAALRRTGIPFAEGAWRGASSFQGDYGVYAIDGRADLIGDGLHAERMLEGTVDLFCASGNGLRQAAQIEDAMDSAGVSWRVGMAGEYEDGTGLTRWEWIFRCLP